MAATLISLITPILLAVSAALTLSTAVAKSQFFSSTEKAYIPISP
jgi:hypothetical protein